MRRIGLALSGGGFRATLFHLGLVRFLREAGVLPEVTHITSVSGGSILAAHLALNWGRYNGEDHQFEAAAREVVDFVRLDIRNRIIRRYPLAMPIRALQRLAMRRPSRQLTRTGLLEYHYEHFLYGDKCLFELPEQPRLYILATNLSEGCLCSFTRDGLLMQKRLTGRRFRFDRVHVGLATVPMAVTASSAFPGFFAPLELSAGEVGANPGEFPRQTFTDGGVFDNLGVRMFRCLERSWMARELPLRREEFVDVDRVVALVQAAAGASGESPVGWLAQQVDLQCTRQRNGNAQPPCPELADRLVAGVWDVIRGRDLARDPAFGSVQPSDSEAEVLLHYARDERRELDPGEQMWLNRQMVDAAFRQATGAPCFRALSTCFDGVLVSDAGKPFQTIPLSRAGTLLGTAMRASDILMDRVWQLEKDTFEDTPGFVFAPITRVVEPAEDPTAMHPEIQRHAATIRTDLDRFSELEIGSLIRHGYCVARQACRSQPDLFGKQLPDGPPWDPTQAPVAEPATAAVSGTETNNSKRPPCTATLASRQLQASSQRRIWSTLASYRDWTTFIYVPLLVPILLLLPIYLARMYRDSQVYSQLMESVIMSSPDYQTMKSLLQDGTPKFWKGDEFRRVGAVQPPTNAGFEVISDCRILDFRNWNLAAGSSDPNARVYGYRRVRVRKTPAPVSAQEPKASAPDQRFVSHVYSRSAKGELRFPEQRLIPDVVLCEKDSGPMKYTWELTYDFSKIPPGETVDLLAELMAREGIQATDVHAQSVTFTVEQPSAVFSIWMLLPEGRAYRSFDLIRYKVDEPCSVETVEPTHRFTSEDQTMIAFGLLAVKPGYTYECRWTFR